jgi:hypothetical protein
LSRLGETIRDPRGDAGRTIARIENALKPAPKNHTLDS